MHSSARYGKKCQVWKEVKGERGKGNTCTKRHLPVLFALKHVDSIDFATDK